MFKNLTVKIVLLSVVAFVCAHYVYLITSDSHQQFSHNLRDLKGKLSELEEESKKIKDLRTKLAGLTGELGTPQNDGNDIDYAQTTHLNLSLLDLRDPEAQNIESLVLSENVDRLSEEMRNQIFSLSRLVNYFENQREVRAILPSICPVKGRLSSPFGMRFDPYTGDPTLHTGIDFAAPEGTLVVAPAYGRVLFAGNDGGFGNLLVIDHGFGFQTQYAHLKESLVEIGTIVERGQTIAQVGSTGRSTGPHLHYEVRKFGIPVNPTQFMID